MTTEMINAVFSGLVLVLGGVGALLAGRSRRVAVDRREYRALQRLYVIALRHIFAVETAMALRGIDPPERPPELDQDGDDDSSARPLPVLPPPPTPTAGGPGG